MWHRFRVSLPRAKYAYIRFPFKGKRIYAYFRPQAKLSRNLVNAKLSENLKKCVGMSRREDSGVAVVGVAVVRALLLPKFVEPPAPHTHNKTAT